MSWFVINYISRNRKRLPAIIEAVSTRWKTDLEYFAPTFILMNHEGKEVKRLEKPLFYHYIFIKGDENVIKDLCFTYEGFSYVIDRAGTERHMQIDDPTMEALQKIARIHSNNLPCFPLEDIQLEKGDKVQIVEGDFSGLQGTYMSKKGGKSGNILIAVSQNLGVVVYDIKAEYVRVLEFSRDSKRIYDQIDAMVPVVSEAMNEHRAGRKITPERFSQLLIFTRRLGQTKINNPKLEAKLSALLAASYRLLGQTDTADLSLARYNRLESHITNPKTKTLIQSILPRF